jgi:DNA helicase HerA-like ATPase
MNDHITPIGRVDWREDSRMFGLKKADRRYHLLAIGRTGAGKSTLLGNLIESDLRHGEGVAVFDPHGDLAEAARRVATAAGRSDGLYFSPGMPGNTLTFNPLAVPRPEFTSANSAKAVLVHRPRR